MELDPKIKYIDVHSHLAEPEFDDDRDAVYARMEGAGGATITIGTDLESSRRAVACAERYENVWATVGLHPLDNKIETFDEDEYVQLTGHPKVVGVGECGLDYFRDADNKEEQRERFTRQIEFAIKHDKPLMIHGRPSARTMDAYEDILSILESCIVNHESALRGNAHFFVGTTDIAQRFFDLGFTVSFSGVITFAPEYEEVVRSAPLEMIHAETDAPYAAPVPHRGKRNEPSYVVHTLEKIAEIRGERAETVHSALRENAARVFALR